MLKRVFATLFVVALTLPATAAHHTLIEQIEAELVKFEAAFAAGDGAAVAALYTEDGQLLPPGGAVVSGREAIASTWQGVIEGGVARLDLTALEVLGEGDFVSEIGRFEMFNAAGESLDTGKYIVVWQKSGDGWKLHRDIWNAVP